MSDWLLLSLLAVGFYLYECCTWTAAAAVACYRRPFRRTWAAASGAELVGNESGGFAFGDPLRLSGNLVHCASWPVAVSPDGMCIDTVDADRFWAFESVTSISAHEKTVRFNGEAVCRAATESHAAALVVHLERIRGLSAPDRARAIGAALHDSFDADALRSTWQAFVRASRRLARFAALPLVWLAVITPSAFVIAGPLNAWPYLLAGLFISSLIVASEFVRLHRQELPSGADRWLHAVSMTLFPIAAIRAVDRISKEKVSHFSPLVVIGVFCDAPTGDPLLRRFGFDLERTAPQPADSAAGRCRAWYQLQKRSAFRTLLTSLKRDPFAEPTPLDASLVLYCPRCHGQFGDGTSECSDCVDVALARLSSAPVRREPKPRKRRRA
jgi:hypothetical protein